MEPSGQRLSTVVCSGTTAPAGSRRATGRPAGSMPWAKGTPERTG